VVALFFDLLGGVICSVKGSKLKYVVIPSQGVFFLEEPFFFFAMMKKKGI